MLSKVRRIDIFTPIVSDNFAIFNFDHYSSIYISKMHVPLLKFLANKLIFVLVTLVRQKKYRQTERQTEKQTDRQTDRQSNLST